MNRCPLCGGRALYCGFTSIDCATAGCPNGGKAQAAPAQGPAESNSRQLMSFAMSLSVGQQWTELSSGKLFELVAVGSNSVDLDSCFGPHAGQWVKRRVPILDLADPSKWRHLTSPTPPSWSLPPAWPGGRPGRP